MFTADVIQWIFCVISNSCLEKNSITGLWKGPNYATAQFDRKMLKQNFIQYILFEIDFQDSVRPLYQKKGLNLLKLQWKFQLLVMSYCWVIMTHIFTRYANVLMLSRYWHNIFTKPKQNACDLCFSEAAVHAFRPATLLKENSDTDVFM